MQLTRSPRRLHVRFCLHCGHDGPELQQLGDDSTFVCQACGADLYARPPRSYAELEGLVPPPEERIARVGRSRRGVRGLLIRAARFLRALAHR